MAESQFLGLPNPHRTHPVQKLGGVSGFPKGLGVDAGGEPWREIRAGARR